MDDLSWIPSDAKIDRELVSREGLKRFIKLAWPILEPSNPLEWSWHMDAVCEHVEALYNGKIQNLLITIPPGFAKSLTCSVFAPAWKWTINPEEKLLYVACTKALSTRDSIKTRNIITSHWYRERWGHVYDLKDDQNTTTKFENNKTGYRLSSSIDGTITGERCSIMTLDDLLQVMFAESEAYRKAAGIALWEVLPSRFNDQRTGRQLMICQRVHSDDPPGQMLAKEKERLEKRLVHLNLPNEAEVVRCSTKIGFNDPRTAEGQLLDPIRLPLWKTTELKDDLGSYAYAAQYQQQPVPREGGLVKESWLKNRFQPPNNDFNLENLKAKKPLLIVQSGDFASKPKEHNDPSVIHTIGVWRDHSELWNVERKRMEFPDGKRKMKELGSAWNPHFVLIEDKDAGQQYIQDLRADKDYKWKIVAMDPEGLDKFTRMSAETPYIEAGKLWLPEMAPWLSAFISELTLFNLGAAHDDQVDALSQFLKWLKRWASRAVAPGGNLLLEGLEQSSTHEIA